METKEKGRERQRKRQVDEEEEQRRKVSRGRELKSKTRVLQRTNVCVRACVRVCVTPKKGVRNKRRHFMHIHKKKIMLAAIDPFIG